MIGHWSHASKTSGARFRRMSLRLLKDRVPKRQGERELAVGETMDEPFNPTIVEFDRAATNANTAAEAKSDSTNQQTTL